MITLEKRTKRDVEKEMLTHGTITITKLGRMFSSNLLLTTIIMIIQIHILFINNNNNDNSSTHAFLLKLQFTETESVFYTSKYH